MASDQRREFTITVQSGILQSLGIDMYATLGKCLVEFLANAYDGEASEALIDIPFADIEKARTTVRAEAKRRVQDGAIDPFTVLNEPLPQNIVVSVRDDGMGMTPEEIQNKFLPINRNRRIDAHGKQTRLRSDSGKRFVMGRKGLGKLAGFGVAERIEIVTKKAGDTFATMFVLDQKEFTDIKDIRQIKITPTYKGGLKTGQQFTEIRLSRLKCDAVRQGDLTLKQTLIDNFFGIPPSDFAIKLNGEVLKESAVKYDFVYPDERKRSGMATSEIDVEDGAVRISFDYVITFRKPGEHLAARNRGARVYCNGRLAAGPSLLSLPTGMHSFHSSDYMECTVVADEVDRHGVDLINTNRTQLKENNELVQRLLERITGLMSDAIRAHAKYREKVTEEELEQHSEAAIPLRIVDQLPSKQKRFARRLVNVVAQRFPPGTDEFRELAPLILQSMNATDVLIKLTEAGTNAKDISQIGGLLRELSEVERSDVLKVYRGKRSAITALERLIGQGEEQWRKKQFENELHELLRENPWFIRPEYSRYLTSNQTMATIATELAKHLGVDDFADTDAVAQGDERPDLVFTMADGSHPHELHIVELKSPALPLSYEHLEQLRGYIFQTAEFLKPRFKHPYRVFGTLIGTRPLPTTTATESRRLNAEIANRSTGGEWEVVDVRELLHNTKRAHMNIIEALEKQEAATQVDQQETKLLPPTDKKPKPSG